MPLSFFSEADTLSLCCKSNLNFSRGSMDSMETGLQTKLGTYPPPHYPAK